VLGQFVICHPVICHADEPKASPLFVSIRGRFDHDHG
jgi:hypothetical protein